MRLAGRATLSSGSSNSITFCKCHTNEKWCRKIIFISQVSTLKDIKRIKRMANLKKKHQKQMKSFLLVDNAVNAPNDVQVQGSEKEAKFRRILIDCKKAEKMVLVGRIC